MSHLVKPVNLLRRPPVSHGVPEEMVLIKRANSHTTLYFSSWHRLDLLEATMVETLNYWRCAVDMDLSGASWGSCCVHDLSTWL